MQKFVSSNFSKLSGEINIPADKSISHRAVILSSLAKGQSVIKNFSAGQDPKSTLEIFQKLGVEIEKKNNNTVIIKSSGKLKSCASNVFNCGNSGTTMRLMSGVLAGQNFNSVLIGDDSLSKRPMKRIIEPLTLMGASIESIDYHAPLKIFGKNLHGITYSSKISSAQVKSCVLLAGLFAEKSTQTVFSEPFLSRNHTEIMLKNMGADIEIFDNTVKIKKSSLQPINIEICGDISSAAFFMAAALIVPNSKIIIKNVGLNPTRTGIIDIIQKMNGNLKIIDIRNEYGEPVGDIEVEYSELKGCEICADIIPRLIDEIPIIAVLATQAKGETIIKDAQDLRNKESDRITSIVKELNNLGANIEETPDGMIINGKTDLSGGVKVQTYRDHRLAMSLYIAGLICKKEIVIEGFEWVNISFPEFTQLIEDLKV